jgi:hypothetical protein
MSMAEEAPFERWQLEAAKHCAPLFIQDAFLSGGHDATTRNASATFVRFENRYFACTCRHAVELVQKRQEVGGEPFATLMLVFNRTFNPLTFITAEGLIDLVQVVPPGSEHYLDSAGL